MDSYENKGNDGEVETLIAPPTGTDVWLLHFSIAGPPAPQHSISASSALSLPLTPVAMTNPSSTVP
ncbi:hypothetical protein C0995_001134 [Termitomyces sp. Mi166|nr:hypothetical protein C0995_001134 [Termitomyces sp. Mi166\